jgi:CheY-like chemotaxis protein
MSRTGLSTAQHIRWEINMNMSSTKRIRALQGVPQPRLVALTGWGQDEDKRLAAQAGFDEHWTKPVDPARLQQLTS